MPPLRSKARGPAGVSLVKDLADASFGPFLVDLAKSKKAKGAIEGISDLTRQQYVDVCVVLERHVQGAVHALVQAMQTLTSSPTFGPTADDDDEDVVTTLAERTLPTLRGAALLAYDLFMETKGQAPQQLHGAAVQLHDNALLALYDYAAVVQQYNCGDVQDAVAKLCCAWWEQSGPAREELVSQALPYLLVRALGMNCRASDVKQCYTVREALSLFDFDDPSIVDTKRMMLRAALSPAFLKSSEGKRFISSLFGHQAAFVQELAAIVRSQIPSRNSGVLKAYGEIVLRAWKDTVGPCAYEVETELVQGLMQAAIYARTPSLAAGLRTVLEPLHDAKDVDKRVSGMLARLYEPILFRAFGVANADVRRNALELLLAAFPILDQEAPPEQADGLLTQQLMLIRDSLADPAPRVRELAVAGVCQVLNLYWEIIPAATSALFIGKLADELAFDVACPSVRKAVVNGLRLLVDNAHAQPVLKKVLPSLAPLMTHDVAQEVREAMALLLLAVSASRTLHFYKVVQLEDLLHVMGTDEDEVAGRVQQILTKSYFPDAEEGPARLAALLGSNPPAGQAFCRLMVRSYQPKADADEDPAAAYGFTCKVPIENILRLAADLTAHLRATVPAPQVPTPPPKSKRAKPAAGGGDRTKQGAVATRGKRRKGKPVPSDHAADEGAGDRGAQDDEDPEEEQQDEVDRLVGDEPVPVAVWTSILTGLAHVCAGIEGAVAARQCNADDVAAALPADCLEALYEAVADNVMQPGAMWVGSGGAAEEGTQRQLATPALELPRRWEDVMRMAASLHFTAGATRLRARLFQELANLTLPGLVALGTAPGQASNQRAMDGLLQAALHAMSTGSSAPKLAAMLMTSLGVREAQPIRKPAPHKKPGGGAAAAAGDVNIEDQADAFSAPEDMRCGSCHLLHPEHNMLLCDGCDSAYHMTCLRPALSSVPSGDWFCHACEAQVQAASALPRAVALRCLSMLLLHGEGKGLLMEHTDVGALLQALHNAAMEQADDIVSGASSGEVDSADTGGGLGHDGLKLYCSVALHMAMSAYGARHTAAAVNDEDEDEEEEERDREEEAAAKEARMQEMMAALVQALQTGTYACQHLAQVLLQDGDAIARRAGVSYCFGLLRVLHDVQLAELLQLSAEHVARVCAMCRAVAQLCCNVQGAAALADEAGEAGAVPVVEALGTVLMVVTQLAEAAPLLQGPDLPAQRHPAQPLQQQGDARPRGGGGDATAGPGPQGSGARGRTASQDDGEADETSQQLEERLNAAGDPPGAEGPVPPPADSVNDIAAELVRQLAVPGLAAVVGHQDTGKALRRLMSALLKLAEAQARPAAWACALCVSVGSALQGSAMELCQELLGRPAAGGGADATAAPAGENAAEAAAAADAGARGDAGGGGAQSSVRGVRGAQGVATAPGKGKTDDGAAEKAAGSVSAQQMVSALRAANRAAASVAEAATKAASGKARSALLLQLTSVAEQACRSGQGEQALGALFLARLMGHEPAAMQAPAAATAAAGIRPRRAAAAAASTTVPAHIAERLQAVLGQVRALQPLLLPGGDGGAAALPRAPSSALGAVHQQQLVLAA